MQLLVGGAIITRGIVSIENDSDHRSAHHPGRDGVDLDFSGESVWSRIAAAVREHKQ